ncbi:hypothetical protein [Sunxiuqinia indica]|uniref:hypothetical protein n=1 Tax=Sunxiuqinia indica TaxID=2692584 RepID=UPI001359BF6D|nr:hypothetical protein [Sunxiuqinia indica]
MRIKDQSVKVKGITPEILLAGMIADQVCRDHGEEVVITSGVDGKHSLTSLHYSGNAIDIRTRFFSKAEAQQVRSEIKERLGIDYDVIQEADHIHIEFQPRYR